MNQVLAEKIAKELRISINQVVREYWEMLILKELSQLELGDFLIFGDGTALRLSYGSPRFSDDLDFYLKKKLSFSKFKKQIERLAEKLEIEITDLAEKRFTLLAEFKIKENYLKLPFRIKIEIRKKIFKRDFETRLLSSPTVNFQVLMFVVSFEKMKELKEAALKSRNEPRDLFDLWFICQKLKIPFQPKVQISSKKLKQELSKYLPADFKKVIDSLIKK